MKKTVVCVAMLLAGMSGVSAQNKEGGISEAMLERIRSGYAATPEQKAVKNALASNSIAALAVNSENLAMCDTHFSHRVTTRGITNQKSSGRCWLFTGLNVLRAKMIREYDLPEFEFSQNYCSFYDLLEKSNLFLQAVIDTRDAGLDDRKVDWLMKNPIGDGGQFTGVSNLIMKYGVVPKSAMPETYQSDNTSGMTSILKQKLREYALELRAMQPAKIQERKTEMLTEIYRILVECLGVPPTEFEWTYYDKSGNEVTRRTYTPKSFYDEFIGEDLERNYVMIMNDPSREYGKVYEIDRPSCLRRRKLALCQPAHRADQGDRHSFDKGQYGHVFLVRRGQVHGSRERYARFEEFRLRIAVCHLVPDGQARAHTDLRQRIVARHDPHRGRSERGRGSRKVDGREQLGRVVGISRLFDYDRRVVRRVYVPSGGGAQVRPRGCIEDARPEADASACMGPYVLARGVG